MKQEKSQRRQAFWVGFSAGMTVLGGIALILLAIVWL